MRGGSIWRQRATTWGVPLGFLLVNLALLFGNQLVLGVRLLALENQLETRETRRAELEQEYQRLGDLVQRALAARADLDGLYQDRLASKRERLTSVLAHVKDLASRAGLEPDSLSYPETVLEEQGLEKLAFVFAVEGDYPSLRRFMSLLEATDEFLVLEQIGVSEAGDMSGGRLSVRLTLTTLFALDGKREAPST
jgi:Tfp pilus assembly protein PilO